MGSKLLTPSSCTVATETTNLVTNSNPFQPSVAFHIETSNFALRLKKRSKAGEKTISNKCFTERSSIKAVSFFFLINLISFLNIYTLRN